MEDYIALFVQFLDMQAQRLHIDCSSVRDCLNRISDPFRTAPITACRGGQDTFQVVDAIPISSQERCNDR
jgi:hypothetical protein